MRPLINELTMLFVIALLYLALKILPHGHARSPRLKAAIRSAVKELE